MYGYDLIFLFSLFMSYQFLLMRKSNNERILISLVLLNSFLLPKNSIHPIFFIFLKKYFIQSK